MCDLQFKTLILWCLPFVHWGRGGPSCFYPNTSESPAHAALAVPVQKKSDAPVVQKKAQDASSARMARAGVRACVCSDVQAGFPVPPLSSGELASAGYCFSSLLEAGRTRGPGRKEWGLDLPSSSFRHCTVRTQRYPLSVIPPGRSPARLSGRA